ncbi:hypothetical protein BDF20DRAFT_672026 [Mycotypha africana]|uniref:uncharacterized protein n=1 Tax=Mycotypha africana TaxID=64632 RepID=UPI0022FFC6D0|nr:uncharacterized protein BDF20DRAFT_672026 [Mycotypha africana]KAI8973779.1 hypothetical protein BDF20DRAFT_672026 [Mycotypha africana]
MCNCYFLAPNPITGCLCEVINDCSCVASHLREVKIDDNSSEVDSTGFSDEANSLAVLSPQATDFLNTINSGIAANPADAELQPLMQPTSSNTVESTAQISKVQSSEPHMNPANITQNDFNTFVPHIQNASTILGEQDQDLANFLFNDLDKYLT